MRVCSALFSVLAGCSLLVPPKLWHPTPQLMNERECPPYLFPALDTLVASAAILSSVRLSSRWDPTYLATAILAATPWEASATYGWIRMRRCEREL